MRRFPLGLMAAAVALGSLGCLALRSATGEASYESSRHLAGLALGVGLALGLAALDYRRVRRLAPWLYLAALVALLLVLAAGVSARGAQRWLSLGPLGTLQPSEPARLALVLVLARLLAVPRVSTATMAAGLALGGIPALLVALQPDLGTALSLAFVTLAMLFVAGARPVYLAGLVTAGAAALPSALEDYQRNRLLVFFNPDQDPGGLGYNLAQSKTAIGSGGLWGAGLGHGWMSRHAFVPENHTDFLFTILGEELGFAGCLGVLVLFGVLLALLVRCAWRAADPFGALLCTGVAASLGFQALVNMGMTVGLLPVVGVPLPLMSYGGSALLTHFAALGLAASVAVRRHRREEE